MKIQVSLFFYFIILLSSITSQNIKCLITAAKDTVVALSDFEYNFIDSYKNNFVLRDYYEFTDPSKMGYLKLPYREYIIPVPAGLVCTFQIVDKQDTIEKYVLPSFNPAASIDEDSHLSNDDSIADKIVSAKEGWKIVGGISYFSFRGNKYCKFRINSHYFDIASNGLRLIKIIKIFIKYAKGNFQSDLLLDKNPNNQQNNKSVNGWINFNSDYLKIATAGNSLYRISKKNFDSLGVSGANIIPATFKLFKEGKEIPIFVNGEEDGSFDEGDYIEFYGGMNYPKISHRILNRDDEEYNEFLNRYTDSLYYFLTWNGERGKRVHIQKAEINCADTLDYYYDLEHFEKNNMVQSLDGDVLANQLPNWNKNKSWYWEWIFAGTVDYKIKIENHYAGRNANVFAKLVSGGSSRTDNSHELVLKFNNVKIDSQSVGRYKQALLGGKINLGLLVNGENILSVENIQNGTNPNYLALDWLEIEYPKNLSAENDSLLFKVDEELPGKVWAVKIYNAINQDYVLYKIKPDCKKIESFKITSNRIVFADTIKGGDEYILISKRKIKAPQFIYRNNYSDLLNSQNSAEYILITHGKFMKQTENYARSVSHLTGIVAKVVNVSDIYDQFSNGFPYPESIKIFMREAFQKWKTPALKYLALIGDANYDYKYNRYFLTGVKGGTNYLPSYGFPVSDNWYVCWNDSVTIPEMIVGRIPVNSPEELKAYSDKIENYYSSEMNEWNKKFIFFSGGHNTIADELAAFKNVNDSVIDKFIRPAPLGGNAVHFYKTAVPRSDFGPYTASQFNAAVSSGALIISYLGHSGTATWDNSISEPVQLKNNVNRNPLITDFGCSTNKFAEPDIVSFGEKFLLHSGGDAVGYIGNSSLGIITTSLMAPLKFFKSVSQNPSHPIGEQLLQTKLDLISESGFNSINKIFTLTNCLLGDPTVKLKIPLKPNLHLDSHSMLTDFEKISDSDDSVKISYRIQNLGRAENKIVQIRFIHKYNGEVIRESIMDIPLPLFNDTLFFWIKTKYMAGEHELSLHLDQNNIIDELDETDNILTNKIVIASSSLRDLNVYKDQNAAAGRITLLNPSDDRFSRNEILFQLSENEKFDNPNSRLLTQQRFYTAVPLSSLNENQRYWYRYKLSETGIPFSSVKSFTYSSGGKFLLNDKYSFEGGEYLQTKYSNGKVGLAQDTLILSLLSAGAYAGSTCVISVNGINMLSNSYFAGIGLAVFDGISMKLESSKWYNLFNNGSAVNELAQFINSIPSGKIVAVGVSDDAANNLSAQLKDAIKSLGSTKIDSLKFQGSWGMIGKKGALKDEVIEILRDPFGGPVRIEKIFTPGFRTGKFITQKIGPAAEWKKIIVDSLTENEELFLIAYKKNNACDTLKIIPKGKTVFLTNVDAHKYPLIKVGLMMRSGIKYNSNFRLLGVQYEGVPELGINYQGISKSRDTLQQGEAMELSCDIFNAGYTTAKKFTAKVGITDSDGPEKIVYTVLIDSIAAGDKKKLTFSIDTTDFLGQITIKITIDPENEVVELFKDNNVYSIPVYIIPNKTAPSVKILFDEKEIEDGDFVSSKPEIKIMLSENSNKTNIDTSACELILNGKKINYLNNPVLRYYLSAANPLFTIKYTPELAHGDYQLKILSKNAYGHLADPVGIIKRFTVSNELRILNIYNYPNPFSNNTYFTFELTQIPDELTIKIFTLSGRQIKVIDFSSSELKYGFNKVFWDGRDSDADLVANGIYLYKIILKKGMGTITYIKKLGIIR